MATRDTGGTILSAADALFDNGAAEVVVAATHGVFSGPAVDRLKNSRISEVVVTDTLPISSGRQFDKLTMLPIASLIARAIKEIFDDGPVTSLLLAAKLRRRVRREEGGRHLALVSASTPTGQDAFPLVSR